jgi:uncharacterized protein
MAYDIIIGRTENDKKKFGDKGAIFLGRHYVKMGQTTSLSNNIMMDVIRAHVVLVSGKRGSGKSFSLGVIAEEMSSLPKEVSQNLSIIMFDTMGIFWTMKYPNKKEIDLLEKWKLHSKKLETIDVYIPEGFFEEYKQKGILADYPFSIRTSELNAGDWANIFNINLMEPIGIIIEKITSSLQERKLSYDIDDIIREIEKDKTSEKNTKDAAINLFSASKSWGLFKKKGTLIRDIVKRGRVSIIDTSCYSHISSAWSIKSLVTGLVSKKLMMDRITARKVEELKNIKSEGSLFGYDKEEKTKEEMPLVWIFIDEAHEFLPREGKTAASDALIQLLREGRQPGISMILATQQPGEIHRDVITQSDIVISHRVTARKDIEALNGIMQTYVLSDIQKYLNNLPKVKGSAIILDDNSEKIYPMQIRPRFTWHGGEAPVAYHPKKQELLDLGL